MTRCGGVTDRPLHPLPDGNKRAGYDVMIEFIERNGASFVHGGGGLAQRLRI